MLSVFAKFLAALNANSRPGEIGAAAAFGCMLALIPSGNLLWFGLFVLVFLLKVHLATALLVMALGKLIVPLADPLVEALGLAILNQDALFPIFTAMSNMPLVPYTNFNNSLVTGGLAAGIIVWVPLFFLFILLVKLYRTHLWPRLAENKLVKGFLRYPLIKKISSAVGKVGGFWKGVR
ncbi:TIGR03546 family protein [Marispirochaeta sp.]|uniref:TIGR03546 family protein n=1 Tax=Marispirochaeta sp. TaxID=2038653 RepID=UPI0029C6E1A4|nr:TIGR03546 family protein [Marispirochaeta sp.]